MKRHHKLLMVSLLMIMVSPSLIFAQDDIKDNEFNPVNTGATSLTIAPDARGAGMGNIGAATDPDVNSQFWNASKYAFAIKICLVCFGRK